MKNNPTSNRAWRAIALLLCLCLVCLPLLGMAQAVGGDSDADAGEQEAILIDIMPEEEAREEPTQPSSAPADAEQPEAPIETEQPEAPAETEQPETPAETEQPEVPAETEQPEVPDETEPPEIPDETEPPEVPVETEPPQTPTETPPPVAPSPTFTINILRPSGWYTDKASVTIRVIDENKTAWEKVEVKIEKNGSWVDLTDSLVEADSATVEISENCTIYVTVTDKNDKAHTKSAYIECFDREAPTVRAGVDGEMLRVEASDNLAGVESVYVNGYRFTGLVNGTLNVRLKDYADEYEQMSVVAVDYAGNQSKTVQVKNPYYGGNEECKPKPTPTPTPKPTKAPSSGGGNQNGGGSGGKQSSAPASTPTPTPTPIPIPTPTPISSAEEPAAIVAGTGFSENGNSVTRDLLYDKYTNKQFIAVQTKDGNTFYIIIDYDKPIDEAGESYETYFLNLVDNADLMALVKDGQVVETPEVCICTNKCVAGNVNTNCPVCKHNMSECLGKEAEPEPVKQDIETPPKEEPKSNPAGAIIVVLLLLGIGGAAVWYFKFRKPKDIGKGKNILDDYGFDDDGDEEYEDEALADASDAERQGEDE